MIRLFNAYFPTRTLLLTVTQAALVTLGFVLAVEFWAGTVSDAGIYLLYENGLGRIRPGSGSLCHPDVLLRSVRLIRARQPAGGGYTPGWSTGLRFRRVGGPVLYVFPEVSLGGSTLWIGVGIVGIAVPAWRRLFFVLNRSARFSERAIIYGDGPLAEPLMAEIANRAELGVRVVGFVGQSTPTVPGIPQFEGDIEELVLERNVQRVLVTMGARRGKLQVEELLKLKARGVYIQDGPEYYESVTGKIRSSASQLAFVFSRVSRSHRPADLQTPIFVRPRLVGDSADLAPHAAGCHRHSSRLTG